MKKGCIILPLLLVLLCVSWVVHRQAQDTAQSPQATPPAATPAEYPRDMWEKLANKADIHICRAPALTQAEETRFSWQRGESAPPLGDAAARRGGVLRTNSTGPYPAHFLAFGSHNPQFFHYNLFDCINIPLVRQHPRTGDILPGLAVSWTTDGRQVHFKLHPGARYSNGQKLRAADFALGALLRAEAGADGAWQRLQAEIERVDVRGEDTLSVTLRRERPLAPLVIAALLHPAEPGFYREFGSDYTTRYAQRIPPTTGAYTVEHLQRGRLIRLKRVANWWGDAVPTFHHTCNAEALEYHFLTDEAQAWEWLKRGKLNLLQTRYVQGWVQRREEREQDTRIQFTCKKVQQPHPPYGIAINAAVVPDINLRRGIAHAMDMRQAIHRIFCGEYEQLAAFASGYPWQKEEETSPIAYNPDAARAAFAEAGYTQAGNDGILQQEDGTRLSIPLLYPPSGRNTALVSLLVQQARLCGLEIRPEAAAWQVSARALREKSHHLLMWATVAPSGMPDFARHFATDAAGHDAPFNLTSDAMQQLLQRYANSKTADELAAATRSVNQLINREFIWIPGWKENRAFTAHSPHVRFPEHEGVLGSCDVADAHLLWIEP